MLRSGTKACLVMDMCSMYPYVLRSLFLLRDANASAVYAVVVCLFDHPPQVAVVQKRLNLEILPHNSPGTLVY